MKRVLTAVVFLPLFYLMTSHASPLLFVAFVLLCAVLAGWEWAALAGKSGLRVSRPLTAAGTAVVCLAAANPRLEPVLIPYPDLKLSLALVCVLMALSYLPLRREVGRYLETVSVTVAACTFLGVLMGFQALLRLADGPVRGDLLIYYLLLVIWGGDAGALYVGRTFGRRRLAPVLSPKKTVEGAAGSLFFSVCASLAARSWFLPQLGLAEAVALGAGLNVLGQVGDLVESGLKRSAGVKDSASVIPGHGGILDRSDSLLFAGPALFYYYHLFVGH